MRAKKITVIPNGVDLDRVAFDKQAQKAAQAQLSSSSGGNPLFDLMKHFLTLLMIALVLFCLWPFRRLVHVFSAPIGYLFRPYIVYRSREVAAKQELVGSAPRRRGW